MHMTTKIVKAHLQMLGFTALLGGSFIASATISNALPPMVILMVKICHCQSAFYGVTGESEVI